MDWWLFVIVFIIIMAIGYIIPKITSDDNKNTYYKKIDKWRKKNVK